MYRAKKVIMLLAVLIFSASSLFAQLNDQATTDITVTLQKGLSITSLGDLDFGEYIIRSTDETINPSAPANLLVSGEPSKSIDLTFDTSVELDNGTDQIYFTPLLEETGNSTIYSSGSTVTNSAPEALDVSTGELNLWLGGGILVPSNTSRGVYAGTFNITVAYN